MFNIFIAERIFTFYKPERSKKVLTITYEKPFSNSTFAKKKKAGVSCNYHTKANVPITSNLLCNKTTKWQTFKEIIESKINCNIPLKTPEHIEQAVATLAGTIQEAARTTTTPEPTSRQTKTILNMCLIKYLWKQMIRRNINPLYSKIP